MTMRTSDRGIAEIAAHEGIVLSPYRDSTGVWTWGIGHTASAGPPDPASLPKGVARPLSEIFQIFRRDLAKFEARVNATVKVPLQQHEFDALVSFDFNTGGIDRAQLVEHLNRGDRKTAAVAFMNWSKPPEIIPRRRKEQGLFRDGIYSSDGFVPVYLADSSGKVQWGGAQRIDVRPYIPAASTPPPPDIEPPVPSPVPGKGIPWAAIVTAILAAAGAAVAYFFGG